MVKIWGRNNSINVQKVLWTLAELNEPFDRIDAGLHFGVNDTSEFRLMNPNGLVPVLQENDFVLWESHAIMRYLALRDPHRKLLPVDVRYCAIVDQWLEWSSTTVWPNMKPVFRNMVRLPKDQWNLSAIEAGVDGLNGDMQILAQRLADLAYVGGEYFSLADIPLALIVHRWYLLEIERIELPVVRQWYERVAERPAFVKYCDMPLS